MSKFQCLQVLHRRLEYLHVCNVKGLLSAGRGQNVLKRTPASATRHVPTFIPTRCYEIIQQFQPTCVVSWNRPSVNVVYHLSAKRVRLRTMSQVSAQVLVSQISQSLPHARN